VKTKDECYKALGVLHSYFNPMPNRFKDYIAVPKFNGYKSIHTTILGMFRFPTEIQIRTKEMDEIAEYGAAAHFGYSENKRSTVISRQQSEWIKKLQDLVSMYQSSS
jgi:(p)ppGpp synthase/HD superfamily hydrolase